MGSESRRQARVADFAQDHLRTVGPPILSCSPTTDRTLIAASNWTDLPKRHPLA